MWQLVHSLRFTEADLQRNYKIISIPGSDSLVRIAPRLNTITVAIAG
jgi:hypothetical protein